MKTMPNPILTKGAAILGACIVALTLIAAKTTNGPMKESDKAPDKVTEPGTMDPEHWKEKLTPEQYHILRNAGTELPNGEVYHQFKNQGAGTYHCAGCGAELFSSEHKFDSRCGWPSFWDPADIDSIEKREDNKLGMRRVEVVCANCKGHLGHLFEGEGFDTPTDQRFCINGTVLEFVPDEEE
jgi:peptide-methionine (R)-S-oxide reductase